MAVLCRALQPEDYPDVLRIIQDSFPEQAESNAGALAEYRDEPWYDPEHLLVAEEDGRVVSQLGVRVGTLWCAGMAVPAGLIGTVCTLSPYRGRGIGAKLVRHAHTEMARRGLALATLHTGPQRHGFYGRLGYHRAVQETPRLTLPTSASSPHEAAAGPRGARDADAPQLDAIYAACYGAGTGAWSRTLPFWRRRVAQRPKLWSTPPAFLVNEGSTVLAYAAVEETEGVGIVQELASAPGKRAVAAELLRAIRANWHARGLDVMEARLSSTHPLRDLLQAEPVTDRTSYDTVFVQAIDREAFAAVAMPLLDQRARDVGVEVSLVLPPDAAPVQLGAGEKLRLTLDWSDLAALLYNGHRLDSLRAEGAIAVDPDDGPLLDQLFPDTGAARCGLDAY